MRDIPAQTLVSIGVRGKYTDDRFKSNLTELTVWLADNKATWDAIGPPRYLGYNGPIVPGFMRYGEVQMPIRRRGVAGDTSVGRDKDS